MSSGDLEAVKRAIDGIMGREVSRRRSMRRERVCRSWSRVSQWW